MVKFGIGQPVRRVEDLRLLTGTGRYTDDISVPRQAYAAFVRSPHAHARLSKIDTTAARSAAGVFGVFTGDDLAAAQIGDLPCMAPVVNRDGSPMKIPPRPAIARTHVHFAGDTVAMVVGETLAAARDAAELIEVAYEPLPAVTDSAAALKPGAPQIWEQVPGNLAFDWSLGDEAKTAAGFAAAARIVTVDLVNNRVAPSSMEPRNALADYDPMLGKFTLYVSCQSTHGLRKVIADYVLKVPESKVRVVSPDVGGGFGMKIFLYPEYVNVLFAARALGCPVKWSGERAEAFLTDTHGRDHRTHAEVALDKDGKFLAFRVSTEANLGAYASHYGPFIPTGAGSAMLNGVYAFPAVFVSVKGAYTNTAPLDAYRGAGRPEANYVVERVVDAAARETGLSPDEIRRRNFILPSAMPYKTALGSVYDTGDFAKNMTDAMKAAEWAGFAGRKAAAKRTGKLRGMGMATYIEACGGGTDETAQIRVASDGSVTLLIGNQSNGQGHETMYAQLVADRLGVPFESVRVVQGDSDVVLYAGLTGGSRATSVGGTATLTAADRIITKGKLIAAHLMEAAEADVEFADGRFRIAGTDKSKTFVDIVKAAYAPAQLPKGLSPGLDETANSLVLPSTYPNGCHICEIEIDVGTGIVSIERYTIVDDFGRVINPLTLAGQVHGGTVQGIGQALYEGCVYDPESGQLLTGSFMDYCLPRADNVPSFSFAYNELPTTANRLG
ncbi:MAG TPA: xanthine dehydrogenase family protein molybdopterin-binding subunit, partial [Alphaproteobacteria bacterium]